MQPAAIRCDMREEPPPGRAGKSRQDQRRNRDNGGTGCVSHILVGLVFQGDAECRERERERERETKIISRRREVLACKLQAGTAENARENKTVNKIQLQGCKERKDRIEFCNIISLMTINCQRHFPHFPQIGTRTIYRCEHSHWSRLSTEIMIGFLRMRMS